jgi:hypothetical protein
MMIQIRAEDEVLKNGFFETQPRLSSKIYNEGFGYTETLFIERVEYNPQFPKPDAARTPTIEAIVSAQELCPQMSKLICMQFCQHNQK